MPIRTITKSIGSIFATVGIAASLVSGAAGASSAAAETGPATPAGSGLVGHTVAARDAVAATTYWTPERMAKALNADTLVLPQGSVVSRAPGGADTADPAGEPVRIPPANGVPERSAPALAAAPEPAAPAMKTFAQAVPRPYNNLPDRRNGKVYFSKYTDWGTFVGDYVCSGTSVNSPGKSLVWTAGHCVEGGTFYGAHRNWVFVPAYSSTFDGERPYKTWAAKELWTIKAWADNSDFSYDLGAAIVKRVDNLRLTDKIGGHGILFNASRSEFFSAFGYPAKSPFNGQRQYRCDSPAWWEDDPGSGPDTLGIMCDMTGGSSGGGWLIDLNDSGGGYVNSVNSYKYEDADDVMYGPYHGSAGLKLYDFVKNKTA